LTEHDDVISPLLRGAPRLGLALGPALARAGPDSRFKREMHGTPLQSRNFYSKPQGLLSSFTRFRVFL